MATEFETIVETLLVILTGTCIVQAILAGLLLRQMKRISESLGGAAPPRPRAPAPAAEPAPVRPVPSPEPGMREQPGAVPAPVPQVPSVEILEGSPDIQGSIHRLADKYDLSDFIIATLDGLVVVSLYPGSSDDAARFSDLYRRKRKADAPGVTFLEIAYQGESMLAIARSEVPIPAEQLKGIGEDARKILNWWL
ncbi:MAG TPA: hypothetical protein VMS81_06550 [Methanomicrobiales archaeon]|jgi:hypothetical protein|nr:hypothetical protein [Methanomicrobiales archaeon]